jgi:hypothetical protein
MSEFGSAVVMRQINFQRPDGRCLRQRKLRAVQLRCPAPSRLEWQGTLPFARGRRLVKRLDFHNLLTGYRSWPADELSLGGIAVRRTALADAARHPSWNRFVGAYRQAVVKLHQASGDRLLRWRLAWPISRGFSRDFDVLSMDSPIMVVVASLESGNLRFAVRTPLAALQDEVAKRLRGRREDTRLQVHDVPHPHHGCALHVENVQAGRYGSPGPWCAATGNSGPGRPSRPA